MARGRMISRLTGSDRKVSELSIPALALYCLTLAFLDRDGLIDGRPKVLAGVVAPLHDDLRARAHALIEEWVDVGLVTRYNGDSDPVLFFHGFARHQEGMRYDREEPSRLPPPPGTVRCPKHGLISAEDADDHTGCKARSQSKFGILSSKSGLSPDQERTKSGLSPREEKRIDGGGGDRFKPYPGSGKEGGFGGKPTHRAADTPPTSIEAALEGIGDEELCTLLEHWGDLTQISYEHSDWAGLCAGLDYAQSLTLLAVLHFLHVRADKINLTNPAAWVQASIRDGKRPRLSPVELAELRRMADLILEENEF